MNLILKPCTPPLWARSGHSQTILGHLLRSPESKATGMRKTIPLADGDQLIANFVEGPSDTIVSLFHGLTGDIAADYMQRTAQVCRSLGHSVYLVNHRGCGEGWKHARGPYHSGRGEDVSAVIEFARNEFPRKKHLAIGFSLGANALLCLLTGRRGSVLPDFAIAVNAPIDLGQVARSLTTGVNRIYDYVFVKLLTAHITKRMEAGLEAKKYLFPRSLTLTDFDSIFTAPAGGFKNREDYYDSCSTYAHLEKIRVPTVLLTAADDPFVSAEVYARARISSSTTLHIEKYGGHLGYLSAKNTPLGNNRWLDYAIHEAIQNFAK
jgi:uncharacterized protein